MIFIHMGIYIFNSAIQPKTEINIVFGLIIMEDSMKGQELGNVGSQAVYEGEKFCMKN